MALAIQSMFLVAASPVFFQPAVAAAPSLPWMNTHLAPEKRAALLVNAMTLSQKAAQLHGQSGPIPEIPACGNAFRHIPGIPALSIPTFRITNGPVGVGAGDCNPQDLATALPMSMGLAAGFDPTLAKAYGDLMGREARMLGLQVLEAPGMNTVRVGQNGRNFEYLSEDPVLAGVMAENVIRGAQAHDVIAMAKHFVLNDQETNRNTVSVDVDDRTLHEIYLLPFEVSVKRGKVASFMCSYNKIGPTYACETPYTLTTVLRDQWGFKGYVQSDFGATHSTAPALNAGLDLEMQSGTWFTEANLNQALVSGTLTMGTIDQALTRRYTQMFKFGMFDRPLTRTPLDAATIQTDGAIARNIGEQSSVLLKNDKNLLPLSRSVKSIVIVGQDTYVSSALIGGGGSSKVAPTYTVTPLAGIQKVLQQIGSNASVQVLVAATDGSTNASVAAAAAKADVVIVMAGVVTSEGRDRPSLSLPDNQDALVSAVAASNPRTVVVLKDGDPVLMPWASQVPAILEAWYPGQEDGNVVARLLFGLVNPSGKLPVTYPTQAAYTPTSTPDRYPGTTGANPTVQYSEGLYVGYKWYDWRQIKPLFAFGHGLSYTSFKISDLDVTPRGYTATNPIKVRLSVKNTGAREGSEVAQVYLGLPQSTGEPPKRLVAFKKVSLKPGEKRTVELSIDPDSAYHPLSYWDSATQKWTIAAGKYTVYVGNASDNIVAQDTFTVGSPMHDRGQGQDHGQGQDQDHDHNGWDWSDDDGR
ncbi:beta-glucosidase family protein [Paraburkholderia sartisoli]|uniref:Beta-D-glucoside glucohydrolase n=1 Tax=Paraburkholderia sartisoli TaxID=83784 RepID=A0A1H4H7Z8_9BURK|nr:glycoside hydrolase family 3 C-terminal domain-containing protein [Paraburkholderia sartisoli]SEB17967.1 beta-glucosidase [Paraburkholderia sartisoli]